MTNINFAEVELIDLTHTLSSDIPCWETNCGFKQSITWDYEQCETDVIFRSQAMQMMNGIGTHMDAPVHFFADTMSIAEIPLKNLFAACVVIDVSLKMHESYLVSSEDIFEFENKYGKISAKSFVIIYTGWEQFWNQPEKYRNNLIFPSISKEVAEILLEREVVDIGIDTLSPDVVSSDFPVHSLMLGAGKFIIENVANAGQLPPIGSYVIALPIKIKDATEAPVRLVGIK